LNWPRGFGLSPSGISTEAFNSKLNPQLFPVAALPNPGREGHLKRNPWSLSSDLLALYAQGTLRNKTHRILEAVAIYTKHGKRLIKESITVDSDCYVGRKAIKIRALVEGQTSRQSLYISDLLADNGKQEIQDAINANTKQ
jgi:hypothetical protein